MTARVFVRGLRYLRAIVVATAIGAALLLGRIATAVNLPSNARAVDGDNGELLPDADGQSWDHAYKYLQDALAEARTDSSITELWVAATETSGPYVPDRDSLNPGGTGLEAATFELVGNVRMMGGFLGGEPDGMGGIVGGEELASERDPLAHETVVSGSLTGGANSYNVLYAPTGLSVLTTVDGFTDRDGVADGDSVTDTWQRQERGRLLRRRSRRQHR